MQYLQLDSDLVNYAYSKLGGRMKAEQVLVHIANRKDINRIQAYQEESLLIEGDDSVNLSHILVAEEDNNFRGYLQFGLFKNTIPFMHKLYVVPTLRGKGYATAIIREWEKLMHKNGYDSVMLSTSSLSSAQNFYRLMGYRDIGSFMLPNEPLEMIFIKQLEDDE